MARTKYNARLSTRGKVPGKELATAAAGKAASDGEGQRKRSFNTGTFSFLEIRKYQKNIELLLHKMPFNRLVCEIAHDIKSDWVSSRMP